MNSGVAVGVPVLWIAVAAILAVTVLVALVVGLSTSRRRAAASTQSGGGGGTTALMLVLAVFVGLGLLAVLFMGVYTVRSDSHESSRGAMRRTVQRTVPTEIVRDSMSGGARPSSDGRAIDAAEDRSAGIASTASVERVTPDGQYVLHLPDPRAAWRGTFKGSREYEDWLNSAPRWLKDADESPYEQREIPGLISIQSRFPGPFETIVGYSTQWPDQSDALDEARRSAIAQLVTTLLWEIAEGTPWNRRVDFVQMRQVGERLARERLSDLETATRVEVVDRELAGTVYRVALQLTADPAVRSTLRREIESRVASLHASVDSADRKRLSSVFSALGLALCIFLIYCFLNAGTKGHFAWPLRLISFGLFAVILLLALWA